MFSWQTFHPNDASQTNMILGVMIRVLITVFASAAVALFVGWLGFHLIGVWYVWHYNIPETTDLSDDYGLGMLLFFGTPLAALVSLFASSVPFWRLAGRLPIVQRRG